MTGQTVAYVRVSSIEQHLDRQEAAIREAVGGEPDRWFADQVSGSTTDRSALTAMLTHVREGDHLMVSSMDRLGRSTLDCLRLVQDLTERGVGVRFLKEGITAGQAEARGEFTLTVLAAVAQLERAMIRERQAEGIAVAKAKGVYRGRGLRLSAEQVQGARERVESGVPLARVAREAKVSKQTLYDALNARGAYAGIGEAASS